MNVVYAIRTGALCISLSLAGSRLGWGGQSNPPEKEQTGSQAGSSGKAPDQMGARGSTESSLRKCDSDPSKDKTEKKKKVKAKKPAKSTT